MAGDPCLILCGPYEFLADDPFLYGRYAKSPSSGSMPPEKDARMALAAYSLLQPHAGWVSSKAARWLQRATGNLPPGFLQIAAQPATRVLRTAIGPVGIVFFPEGPVPGKGPTPDMERQTLAAGQALKKQTVLVIGISPWGFAGERDFLPKAAGTFACILGGGEGTGFAFSFQETAGQVLWARPDSKGRAVNIIEILEKPEAGKVWTWKEDKNVSAALEFLDDSFSSDPKMQAIIGRAE